MPPTKTEIRSYAAPTGDDAAAWDSLTPDEHKAAFEGEIERAYQSSPIRVVDLRAFADEVFEDAMNECARKNVKL